MELEKIRYSAPLSVRYTLEVEMYSCIIKIEPKHSTSISFLEWDANQEVLSVCYTSSGKCYDFEHVSRNDLLELKRQAIVENSWGRAMHEFKVDRKFLHRERARVDFENMWQKLHPADKRRYARWANKYLTNEATRLENF